jgi:hypothetical protein
MHEFNSISGERKNIGLHLYCEETMGLDFVRNHDAYGAHAAMDCLLWTTLTERVVGFLERYDKSVCSFR